MIILAYNFLYCIVIWGFHLFIFVYIHSIYKYSCLCSSVQLHMNVCVDARDQCWVYLCIKLHFWFFLLFFFLIRSFMACRDHGLAWLTGLICTPALGLEMCECSCLEYFYMSAMGLNLDPCIYVVGTLLIEPCTQTLVM